MWWNEPSNLTDASYGFPGNNFDTAEMMGLLLNQTVELESLKRQTEILKQQTENDRSSIQLLQNRVFFIWKRNLTDRTYLKSNLLRNFLRI